PVKNLGVVQVGPSASGAGFRSLSGSYTLMPLQVAGPAVVGAADLSNGRIASQLIRDFNGGQPVALTNATSTTANPLASMLRHAPGPAPPRRLPGQPDPLPEDQPGRTDHVQYLDPGPPGSRLGRPGQTGDGAATRRPGRSQFPAKGLLDPPGRFRPAEPGRSH